MQGLGGPREDLGAFIWREIGALKGCEQNRSDSGAHRHPPVAATKKTNCGDEDGSQGPRGRAELVPEYMEGRCSVNLLNG